MKKIVIFLCTQLLSFAAFTENADAICGFWLSPKVEGGARAITEIYEEKGLYKAYIFAMEGEYDTDFESVKQGKSYVGFAFLYDLEFDNGSWIGGYIYIPSDDKIFYATVSLDKTGTILKIKITMDSKGFFGITLKWKRLPESEVIKYIDIPRDQLRNPW